MFDDNNKQWPPRRQKQGGALADFMRGRIKNTYLRSAANMLGINLVDEQPKDVFENPWQMYKQPKVDESPWEANAFAAQSMMGGNNVSLATSPQQQAQNGFAFGGAPVMQAGYRPQTSGNEVRGFGGNTGHSQMARSDEIGDLMRQLGIGGSGQEQVMLPMQNVPVPQLKADVFDQPQVRQAGLREPDYNWPPKIVIEQYKKDMLAQQSAKSKRKPGQGVSKAEQAEYLEKIMPDTYEMAERTGLDPRLIAAQNIAETKWGTRVLGNNYFGIKSHGRPGGQKFVTHEEESGKRTKIIDDFRQYGSYKESLEDYANFLLTNQRYKPLFEAKTFGDQLRALQASGYATDSGYFKLISDIAKYNIKLKEGAWRLPDGDMPF